MTKRRKPMTLAEHDALLKREGRYDEMVEAQRERDEALQRKAAAWRNAELPLAKELRGAGFAVDSAWDLVNTSVPYPAALPILLEHLERPYPDRVREGIARALAVRDARFGAEKLIRLYGEEQPGTDAKAGLAVAIGEAADDDVIDEVIALAGDPAHGTSRVLMLDALGRSKAPRARAALEVIAEDPEVGEEARRLLERHRPKR
jgi:hypothetical protein